MFAGIFLLAALWMRSWLQPERQIPRAQARLLSAIERRDFGKFESLLAADYRDRWGHGRATAVARCREVFGQFATLTIEREKRDLRADGDRWLLSEKMRIKGLGGPLAMAAREAVNALREPFITEWRRRSWKPWDWELKSVAQPAIELPE